MTLTHLELNHGNFPLVHTCRVIHISYLHIYCLSDFMGDVQLVTQPSGDQSYQVVGWPSGLRRWFKAPVISMAWVRIPPLPIIIFFFFPPSSLVHVHGLTEFPLPQFWWFKLEDVGLHESKSVGMSLPHHIMSKVTSNSSHIISTDIPISSGVQSMLITCTRACIRGLQFADSSEALYTCPTLHKWN